MKDKLPQATATLVRRLQRCARALAAIHPDGPQWHARVNVCWQAAARLEEYLETHGEADTSLDAVPEDEDEIVTSDARSSR